MGNGTYLKLSWPHHDSGNAWLVIDSDGDGVIKSGKQMFGNYSPHADAGQGPSYTASNGFMLWLGMTGRNRAGISTS
jgi:hypothetical protein